MDQVEYVLSIDVFTPDTLPMGRLAEYMAALSDLVGFEDSVHFVRVDEGSARLVHKVEAPAAPKVERRLQEIASDGGAKDALKAYKVLDELLVEDNATANLIGPSGAVVIPFPGRTRPKPLAFPAFRQDGSIDGQVVSVGGRDATAHVILQDQGITYTGCTLKKEMARELARHLYGSKIRLFGNGRWERHPDGAWKLLEFRVDRYQVLDETPLTEVLADIRGLPGLGQDDQLYSEMLRLRLGDGEVH